ncbi:hypothetical protein [Mycoplasma phocoenae]|uniref:Uncharacterized protein n=1 Tax=Mycoplasma phocoenae TaxID=754517 RepID=A0A858U6Y7_9MOLU|nr:hypothetical protein [Mycoplasma phocoenae]QJG66993.1 hypothetical protein HGG69_01495 [Mycoplasma phocoenae]
MPKNKLKLESIGITKTDKILYFDNVNFSLTQNKILSIVSDNKSIEDSLFTIMIGQNRKSIPYQGFLAFNDILVDDNINTKINNIFHYYNSVNFAFKKPLTIQQKSLRLRQFLMSRFIVNYRNENLSVDFLNKYWKVIKEYNPILRKRKVDFENKTYSCLNDEIEKLFSGFEVLIKNNEHNKITNLDKRLEYLNTLFSTLIMKVHQAKYDIILEYRKYEKKIEKHKLFLQKDQLIHLSNNMFKPFGSENKNVEYTNNTVKRDENQELIMNTILLKRCLLSVNGRLNAFKQKNKITKEKTAFIDTFKRYSVYNCIYKFVLNHSKTLVNLKHTELLFFVKEINNIADDYIKTFFIPKNKYSRPSITQQIKNEAKIYVYESLNKFIINASAKSNVVLKQSTYLNTIIKSLLSYFNKTEVPYWLKNSEIYKNNQLLLKEMKLNYEWNYKAVTNQLKSEINTISKSLKVNELDLERWINTLKVAMFNTRDEVDNLKHSKNYNECDVKNLMFKFKYIVRQYEYFSEHLKDFRDLLRIFTAQDITEETVKKFLFTEYVNKVCEQANINKILLEKKLIGIEYNTIIDIELACLFLTNPNIVVLGPEINALSVETIKYVLSKTNNYVFKNNSIGIYFIRDVNTALNYGTDAIIFNNNKIVEQGKTSCILNNPVHPYIKRALGQKVVLQESAKNLLYNPANFTDDFYEVEPGHIVQCNLYELMLWIDKSKVKNDNLSKLIEYEKITQNNTIRNINDSINFEDVQISNFVIKKGK